MNIKFDLNPQQKMAVQSADKPLLIVAGAGTGKTKTLTGRLAYLIEKGVPAEKIAAITFTNKAAREMGSRVAKIIDGCGASPFIGTFHSLGARILRVEAKFLGRDRNFVIFDDSDSLQIVKKILKTEGFPAKSGGEYTGAAAVCREISRLNTGVTSAKTIRDSHPDGELLIKIFHRYEKELEKNNAFDFDDLIGKVVEIFGTNPRILQKYRRRFHHILVDEYQDLNNKQYELIRLLAGDSPRISVVGDDQQMIYSFRGSNFQIFLDFENDWPDANVILLEENYRSTSNIIDAASAVITNNVNQKPKTLWTKKESGEPVKVIEAADEEEEAWWIAEEISRLQNTNPEEPAAVLYRTNAQSRAIEQALIEKGITYQIFGGLRFYERKEIKDVVAALRYAQNEKDEVSRERLEKNVARWRLAKFQKALGTANLPASPTELIRSFLDATGYLEVIAKNFANAEERRENIAELLHFASEFKDLPAFLEQIALLQPADVAASKLSDSNHQLAVNLMTIHLAKGLEFDNIFVAGCNEGLLPHGRSLKNPAETEEERRLMYVAMTRAKKNLFLSFYDIPSRFLGEIPERLVEFESLVSEGKNFSDLDDEESYITLD